METQTPDRPKVTRLSQILTPSLLDSWALRGGIDGYQARSIRALVGNRRGIGVAPAGSGKTIIVARATEAILRTASRRVNVLWIANTLDQLDQGKAAIDMIDPQAWANGRYVFAHPSGCTPAMAADADILIVDEVHHAAAAQWRAVIEGAVNAKIVWGLTATPHREDGLWPEVESLIGPIVCQVSREEVLGGGHTVQGSVVFSTVGRLDELKERVRSEAFDPDPESGKSAFDRAWSRMAWQIKAKGLDVAKLRRETESRVTQQAVMKLVIAENKARNTMAADLCRRHVQCGDGVLCLVYSVEQGRTIQALVPGAKLLHSKMTVKVEGRRAEILDQFRSGEVPCIVATSLADEGLDVPRASVLVLAAGGRGISKADGAEGQRHTSRLEQRTARVLRSFEDKSGGTIYDFFDHQHPFSASSSWSRLKGYRALGFSINTPQEMRSSRSSGPRVDTRPTTVSSGSRTPDLWSN